MKKKSTAAAAASPTPPLRPYAPAVLLAFAVAESLLAIFQWRELQVVRGGGQAVCELGETLNCATVWNSGFASTLHSLTGLPVAALGLVWGLTASALVVLLMARLKTKRPLTPVLHAIRLTAAVGLVSTVIFILASVATAAACLTCLGTYALVIGFAALAFAWLPGAKVPGKGELGPALAWAAGLTLLFWGVLLPFGLNTPRATVGATTRLSEIKAPVAVVDAGAAPTPAPVGNLSDHEQLAAEFLRSLPQNEQQQISNALANYKAHQRRPVNYPTRMQWGSAEAPVKIVDFTDMKCGHCKALSEAMQQLKRVVPSGQMSVEPRQFPLAGECLPRMKRPDPTGVRCLAAKTLICLEESPRFWEAREKMFSEQESLGPDRVKQIASGAGMSAPQLDACLANSATQEKLEQDMAYAEAYGIQGTPLVLVNGREAWPLPSFLYVLTMAGGNPDSPVFRTLPPPASTEQPGHEGHGH